MNNIQKLAKQMVDDWCDETGILRIGKYSHDELQEYFESKLTKQKQEMKKKIEKLRLDPEKAGDDDIWHGRVGHNLALKQVLNILEDKDE